MREKRTLCLLFILILISCSSKKTYDRYAPFSEAQIIEMTKMANCKEISIQYERDEPIQELWIVLFYEYNTDSSGFHQYCLDIKDYVIKQNFEALVDCKELYVECVYKSEVERDTIDGQSFESHKEKGVLEMRFDI